MDHVCKNLVSTYSQGKMSKWSPLIEMELSVVLCAAISREYEISGVAQNVLKLQLLMLIMAGVKVWLKFAL